MKTTIRNLMAAMLLVAASIQAHAQGTLVYDQQSATGPISYHTVDFFDIQEDSPLTQSFIPTLSAIDFVQFELLDTPDNGNNGATVYVNLWTGSPNINSATFLGSTTPVYMPDGFGYGAVVAGVTNFYFSTTITLNPGQTYFLQPVFLSGDDPWEIAVLTNTYPNGQLYSGEGGFTAPFEPSIDLWFREGVVPEPSTLALVGLSALLVLIFKCRSKLPILFLAGVLFIVPILPVYSGDSVVQITADAAGLTPTSATTLPSTGTFWVMTNNPDGNLFALPYPFLPVGMSTLPSYSVNGSIFIVDSTGGQLSPSSTGRMSTAQAASTMQAQAQTMEDLIEQIEMADIDPTNISGTNGGYQPNGVK